MSETQLQELTITHVTNHRGESVLISAMGTLHIKNCIKLVLLILRKNKMDLATDLALISLKYKNENDTNNTNGFRLLNKISQFEMSSYLQRIRYDNIRRSQLSVLFALRGELKKRRGN